MPSVEQVGGTLPCAFKEKFPTTFGIIDGSEIFIETPTDLHMQSSTWSQYKHNNTAKFVLLTGLFPMFLHFLLAPYLTWN